MTVGDNIRRLRKARGWKILDLATRVGSDVGNISRLERGKQGYSDEMLRKLAAELGCSVADFFSASDSMNEAELRVKSALEEHGWNVERLPADMPRSLLPQEFNSSDERYIPDLVVQQGGKTVYVEIKPAGTVSGEDPASKLVADGKVALITSSDPLLIVEEMEMYLNRLGAPEAINLREHSDLFEVPRVKFKLSAGVTGYAIDVDQGNGKPVFFRKDWFDMHNYRPEKVFAVRVAGASMETSLWDGDLVVINTDDCNPQDGEVFAINFEGELVIKRLRRDSGEWWATSDNADQRRYAPKRCTEDVKIIGRVVYKQSERI